jgi:hypothetical protein
MQGIAIGNVSPARKVGLHRFKPSSNERSEAKNNDDDEPAEAARQ